MITTMGKFFIILKEKKGGFKNFWGGEGICNQTLDAYSLIPLKKKYIIMVIKVPKCNMNFF